tara:strand:- start:660 stop:845 length:186 start_codon:yes stop_codon:yes gene_type:complete
MSMYNNDDIMDKLNQMESKMDQLESKIEELNGKLGKHIDFIDDTYEGLKNPIKMATRFFKR